MNVPQIQPIDPKLAKIHREAENFLNHFATGWKEPMKFSLVVRHPGGDTEKELFISNDEDFPALLGLITRMSLREKVIEGDKN